MAEGHLAAASRGAGSKGACALALLALCATLLTAHGVASILSPSEWLQATLAPSTDTRQLLFHFGLLPRIAVSLLAGAALGMSGAIFGQVLRNPLAEPSTLGTSAGATLALTSATIYFPAMLDMGRPLLALAGGLVATLLVLALSWRNRLSPVTLVLAGLVVALACAAAGSIMVLFEHHHPTALFLWQSGTLAQSGWGTAGGLAFQAIAWGTLALLLARPLVLLELDEAGARSLGMNLPAARLMALSVAVALAASVASSVGLIGFVGLAAPALARLAGARSFPHRLLASALAGAVLLWLADQVVLAMGGLTGAELPAGLLTGLLGAPLLLWLLPQARDGMVPAQAKAPARNRHSLRITGLLLVLLLAACWGSLAAGPGLDGWRWQGLPGVEEFLPWRLPRMTAALAAGALLAVAGVLVQRMTANPMASPELLGVSSGASLGMILSALLLADLSRADLLLSAAMGAGAVLLALLRVTRSTASAERLLMTGIAITTITGVASHALILSGPPRLDLLLRMMTGSTYMVGRQEATMLAVAAVLAVACLPLVARMLDILPLGVQTAGALGLGVARSQVVLVLLVAVLTAAATIVVGPLSFVGLMAPHMARMLGLARPVAQGVAAALIGGLIMVCADWAGRTLAFPWQLPAGVIATLVGAPYFLVLLARRPA